ncbi:MAG: hypothetical protein ACFE8B_16835 [Candidatus Hermodarchaeota archaeon]
MFEHDYYVKVVLTGDDTEGKAYLTTNFCKTAYSLEYKHTLGLDFHGKTLTALGKVMKIQIWELLVEERFRAHFPSYYSGALGAIIISDITNPDFQYTLYDDVQMIKERSGDIPIMLLTFDPKTKSFQAVLGVDAMVTADNLIDESFPELSSNPVENPEEIFSKLAKYIIKRLEITPLPRPLKKPPTRTEFIINKYLNLRLEFGRTNIYVGGRLFKQCKFLLLEIPVKQVTDYDEIESIDEAAEKLDRSLERGRPRKYHISPDIEFWGHCSNLQVWFENEYDTRILHSNLAFPLLHALVRAGDPLARKVFKEEIALRLSSGYPSVVQYLINENYLKYLKREELNSILEDCTFLRNVPKWVNDFKEIPKFLLKRIMANLKHLKCPYCDSKASTTLIKKFLMGTSIKCESCHKDVITGM